MDEESLRKSVYETLLETRVSEPSSGIWSETPRRLGVCLIEFRKHEWMRSVLWNMCNVYGNCDVCLYIVHGKDNEEYIKDIVNDWRSVNLIKLDYNNIDIKTYNIILTSKELYNSFRTEYILIFQTDTYIRKKIPEEFFQYKYVGAPWIGYPNDFPDNPHIQLGNKMVGNGGFSLRHVNRMKEIIDMYPKTQDKPNEDVYFSNHLKDQEVPSVEVAKRFAVEWIYDDDPVGLHQIWRFHSIDRMKELITQRKKEEKKIVDGFIFYNELDMLMFRLEELYETVDYFVLVEATHTHSGSKKVLYYDMNKDKFRKYNNKIIHVIVNDMPNTNNPWNNENYQRECIMRGISKIDLKDDDLIMISDCDEIPDCNTLVKMKEMVLKDVYALRMDMYYYNFETKSKNYWYYTRILPYKVYRKTTPQKIRNTNCTIVANGGWHLSFFGNVDFIKNKLNEFAHQEFNNDYFKNEEFIQKCINSNMSLFDGDKQTFTRVKVNEKSYLPKNYKMLLSN